MKMELWVSVVVGAITAVASVVVAVYAFVKIDSWFMTAIVLSALGAFLVALFFVAIMGVAIHEGRYVENVKFIEMPVESPMGRIVALVALMILQPLFIGGLWPIHAMVHVALRSFGRNGYYFDDELTIGKESFQRRMGVT